MVPPYPRPFPMSERGAGWPGRWLEALEYMLCMWDPWVRFQVHMFPQTLLGLAPSTTVLGMAQRVTTNMLGVGLIFRKGFQSANVISA